MHLRCSLALACVTSAFLHVLPAFGGEPNTAAELFDRGTQHMDGKRYAQACPLLAESYRLDPQLGALFTLAECEAKRGRIATAMARYEEYLELYAKLPPGKKARQGDREMIARAQVKALAAEVPQLVLMLPVVTAVETVVKLDGVMVAAASLGSAMPVDPGHHLITTQAPGGVETKTLVKLEKRQKKRLVLGVQEAPTANAESEGEERSSPGWQPYVLWGGVGLGVVGIGAGIGLTVAANAKAREVDAEVDRLAHETDQSSGSCALKGDPRCATLDKLSTARDTDVGLAVTGFAVGSIAAIAAIVSVSLKPRGSSSEEQISRFMLVPGPRSVIVMGRF